VSEDYQHVQQRQSIASSTIF